MMKCAFEPCLCQIPKGEKYCSDFCEAFGAGTVAITSVEGEVPRLSGRESFKCACGHRHCFGETHSDSRESVGGSS